MRNWSFLLVVLAVHCATVAANAQGRAKRDGVFMDAQVGPDWDDLYYGSTPGATRRFGFGAGLDWESSGIEFNFSVPEWHATTEVDRFHYVGPSVAYEQQGHFYESSTSIRRRSIDVALLYRRNVNFSRHATFTWLVGGAHVSRPEEVRIVTREVVREGELNEVNRFERTSWRNYLAATGRIDLEVRIGPQISLVPRLRVLVFPSFLDDSGLAPRIVVVRPEVAARWRF
jgi:hypothetical protein